MLLMQFVQDSRHAKMGMIVPASGNERLTTVWLVASDQSQDGLLIAALSEMSDRLPCRSLSRPSGCLGTTPPILVPLHWTGLVF